MGWFSKIKEFGKTRTLFITKLPWPFPDEVDDFTPGIFAVVEKKHKNNKSFLAHVETHKKQWDKEGVRYWFKYLTSKKWRLRYEIEAFAEQARHAVSSSERNKKFKEYAGYLSRDYKLNISKSKAEEKLKSEYYKKYK